jgi:hypothetical protein
LRVREVDQSEVDFSEGRWSPLAVGALLTHAVITNLLYIRVHLPLVASVEFASGILHVLVTARRAEERDRTERYCEHRGHWVTGSMFCGDVNQRSRSQNHWASAVGAHGCGVDW